MTKVIKKLLGLNAFLVAGIVFTFISTAAFLFPVSDSPEVSIQNLDKVIHILIHCILCFIWLGYAFFKCDTQISKTAVIFVLVLCVSYGVVIEASQQWFTETRQFDVLDLLANGLGSLLGLGLFYMLQSTILKWHKTS